jgi:DNA-binding TFAR19-related protein (PDSD5 family)
MLSIDVSESRYAIDPEALDDINRLRQIRINLVRDQLMNLEHTMAQLIDRGIVEKPIDHALALKDLRFALEAKISDLAKRLAEPGYVYEDEVQFFLQVSE